MRPNRSLLNSLGQLDAKMKSDQKTQLAAAKEVAETINIEPEWPGMVRYFHANPDKKFWDKVLSDDPNGWFAAVAATHPDETIQNLGRKSPSFKGVEGFAGLKEGLESQAAAQPAVKRVLGRLRKVKVKAAEEEEEEGTVEVLPISQASECPNCHETDTEGEAVDVGPDYATQPMSCLACGSTWDLHFDLEGYSGLEPGDEPKEA